MTRETLPTRRRSEVFDLTHDGLRFTAGLSRFDDGRVAEVFLDAHKTSSPVAAAARDGAVLASLALQFGAPIDTLRSALTRAEGGEAAGVIGAALDCIEAASQGEELSNAAP